MIEPLRLCANGGMKLDATGLAFGCCDPCERAISAERERIAAIPYLGAVQEYGPGQLVVTGFDYETEQSYEHIYDCRAVFYYWYRLTEEGEPYYVLDYFDCENCERITVFASYEPEEQWVFYPLPNVCEGCVIMLKTATHLTTVDEAGGAEDTEAGFIPRSVWQYTNNGAEPVVVFWTGGGDQPPANRWIDDYAQLIPSGQQPSDGPNIYSAYLFPGASVTLWSINMQRPNPTHPWEIHCKLWLARISCEPCEVAIYKALYENTEKQVAKRYGAGFYTGGGGSDPYRAAFVTWEYPYAVLYGFTCDTCEPQRLWSDYAWDIEDIDYMTIPYTADASACDGEEEVQ